MKPMRNSSAPAGAVMARPSARQLPNSIGPSCFFNVLVIVFPPLLPWPSRRKSGRLRYELLRTFIFALRCQPLSDTGGNAHQPHRQIEDREHVDAAKRVLPPRHQRAEIFAQTEDESRADRGADQRAGAAEH